MTAAAGIVVAGGLAYGADFSGVEKGLPKTSKAGKCPVGQASCPNKSGKASECVTLMVDPRNCGSCGKICREGEKCSNSRCVPERECPSGQTACMSAGGKATCSDHRRDMANCGGCGKVCKGDKKKCIEGECVLDLKCPAGKAACEGSSPGAKPMCVDVSRDMANCGGCGKVCTGEKKKCIEGECVLDLKCPAGKSACEGRVGFKATCVDFKRDRMNCGACGKVCKGESETCADGRCVLAHQCEKGKTACMAASGKAVCSDHATDRNNCGGCGRVCPTSKSCVAGACK